jgi:hypothetical protein
MSSFKSSKSLNVLLFSLKNKTIFFLKNILLSIVHICEATNKVSVLGNYLINFAIFEQY